MKKIIEAYILEERFSLIEVVLITVLTSLAIHWLGL